MKKNWTLILLALMVVVSAACSSDDKDSNADNDELVGAWISQGATQVAPGLQGAPFKTAKITAVFNENLTYTVVSTDSSNSAVTYTGTWVAGTQVDGSIRSITLNQSTPSALVSTGIFQVVGATLTYEVIQTTPAIENFAAATVEGGFGSTAYSGYKLGATWTQKFVVNAK